MKLLNIPHDFDYDVYEFEVVGTEAELKALVDYHHKVGSDFISDFWEDSEDGRMSLTFMYSGSKLKRGAKEELIKDMKSVRKQLQNKL